VLLRTIAALDQLFVLPQELFQLVREFSFGHWA
jgi:hypothetical protein